MAEPTTRSTGCPKRRFRASSKAEVGFGVCAVRQRLEFDQEIQIAVLRMKTVGRGRAKQIKPSYMVTEAKLFQFGGVFFNDPIHRMFSLPT